PTYPRHPHSTTHHPSLYSFFFYCYDDHRDLHSFPTRRSSDLFRITLVSIQTCTQAAPPRYGPVVADSAFSGNCTLRSPNGSTCKDRKSTRLNSSHLGISYAVFCLKKKSNCCEKVNRCIIYRWL